MNFWILILLSCIGTMSVVFSGKITSYKHSVDGNSHGTWKKTWTWKSRWVKTWQPKLVYVSNWTRVWTPLEISEYIPSYPVPTTTTLRPIIECHEHHDHHEHDDHPHVHHHHHEHIDPYTHHDSRH